MALDLSSVQAKLRRSSEHFTAVDLEATACLKTEDYSVSKQLNADGTRHSWIFHAHRGLDFDNLSLRFGDCVHNLRSALDHLVYAVAIHESGQNPPPEANRLAFPLTCNSRQFHDSKKRIQSLSLPVRTAIESVQPYNRPHPEVPPLLGLLGAFDDVDKHRLLQIAVGAFHKTSIGYKELPPGTQFQLSINKAPLKEGAEIIAFIFEQPMPKDVIAAFDGDFILVVLHAPGPTMMSGTEVRTLLTMLRREVDFAISTVVAAIT